MTAPAGTQPRSRRRALLLACSRFTDETLPALRSPTRDAEALQRLLDQIGYETRTLTDCTAQEARHAVAEFFETATRRDVNLLYFSCHGLQDAEMNLHFAFSDSQYRRPDVTGVSAEFVRIHIARSRARSTVVIVDCCFSGAFLRAMRPKASRDAGVNALVRDLPEGTGVAVLTSSGATELSLEDPSDQHAARSRGSYFTEAILTGLGTGAADTDLDGRITVDELFSYASDRVADGPSHQKPRKYVEAVGDLVVAAVRVRKPEPGPPVPPPAMSGATLAAQDPIQPWPPLPGPGPGPEESRRRNRRRRSRRPLSVGVALVVALAGGLVLWTNWPSMAQAEPVPVPPVVGLTRADAETAIRSARLIPVAVPASTAAAACATGSVTGQAPAPRSTAAQGSTVTYQVCARSKSAVPETSPTPKRGKKSTVSPAPRTRTPAIGPTSNSPSPKPLPPKVPCVANYSEETATAVLGEAGYNVSTVTTTDGGTPGAVTSQSPSCGTRLVKGNTVRIFVPAEPEPDTSDDPGNGG
ncbi:caspase, EACC1-associated type [Paractinoplanes maris]|uniref:caspase, EACC1-associated type n=1 Tax=Paractinoplanes maris TaxID=1734446 RepID=UPI00202152FC|nr:caspase family protein [Actinoplanes maris]